MATKSIKFQEKIPFWVTREMDVQCPDGETDEETFARIRKQGTSLDGAKETAGWKVDTHDYTTIPDKETGSNQTLNFGDKPLLYRPELGVKGNK